MVISLLQDGATIPSIFSPKALKKLESIGQVRLNDGDSSDEQVKKVIKGADIAITSWGNDLITRDILDEAPNLKLIAHAAGSVKPIVTDEVWKRGIRVFSSAKPLGQGVADTALGFTISALKNYYMLSEDCHNGGWIREPEKKNVTDLFDVTIGVIGSGWAGGHYIRLLSNFDVEVLLYDPYVSAEKASSMGACKVELQELLSRSDLVSIHAPSIPETNNMFNADTLKLMKENAVLVNTARGSIIDEDALYKHMAAGNLKYACLDVFKAEPPAADHPLRSLPNVIITPHIAGLSDNGRRRIGMHVANEIENFLSGKAMETEVTIEMLKRMA